MNIESIVIDEGAPLLLRQQAQAVILTKEELIKLAADLLGRSVKHISKTAVLSEAEFQQFDTDLRLLQFVRMRLDIIYGIESGEHEAYDNSGQLLWEQYLEHRDERGAQAPPSLFGRWIAEPAAAGAVSSTPRSAVVLSIDDDQDAAVAKAKSLANALEESKRRARENGEPSGAKPAKRVRRQKTGPRPYFLALVPPDGAGTVERRPVCLYCRQTTAGDGNCQCVCAGCGKKRAVCRKGACTGFFDTSDTAKLHGSIETPAERSAWSAVIRKMMTCRRAPHLATPEQIIASLSEWAESADGKLALSKRTHCILCNIAYAKRNMGKYGLCGTCRSCKDIAALLSK